jgi:hypothetical protein
MFRHDDVKTDEAEDAFVRDGRDTTDWFTVYQADQEAMRIHVIKALRVVQTRVPSFAGRERRRKIDLVAPHLPNLKSGSIFGAIDLSSQRRSKMPNATGIRQSQESRATLAFQTWECVSHCTHV